MNGSCPFPRVHGGPDASGPARRDFSTNANAAGPCPWACAAVRAADPTRYPDPGYHALRERLAQWHGVARDRIVIAASASEFIQRITAVGARLAPGPVAVPARAYGDYALAAWAWGRRVVQHDDACATLRWYGEPSSPCGQNAPPLPRAAGVAPTSGASTVTVLDAVYAPLRLEGDTAWDRAARAGVFELHSPNKALGLCGVRAAYAVAPSPSDEAASMWIDALSAAASSWPVGAHGVAMLEAWASPQMQLWLAEARTLLRRWKRLQIDMLHALGVETMPSVANFFCARLPPSVTPAALRERGIAVRDTTSFGLPGWVRLSVQPPQAQACLETALRALGTTRPER